MKRYNFFGLTFSEDKNGHYPGQKIFVNRKNEQVKKQEKGLKEKIITSTIEKADLKEFSTVTFGANPDTQIVRQAKEALDQGQLEEKHLHQLSLNYNIMRSDLDAHPEPISPVVYNAKGDTSMDNDKDLTQTEIAEYIEENDRLKAQLENSNQLRSEVSENHKLEYAKRIELEDKVEELEKFRDLSHDQGEEIKRKDTEIAELQDRMTNIRNIEYKASKYDDMCSIARERAVEQYSKLQNVSNIKTPVELIERKRKSLKKIDDYEMLVEWGDRYLEKRDDALARDALRREKGEKTIAISQKPEIDKSRFQ